MTSPTLHVSPCAWYCFEIEGAWRLDEGGERTLLTAPDGACSIEIVAARRTDVASATDEDAIAGIHEGYLRDEGIQAVKTALAENPHGMSAYVTRGVGTDEREHLVCHAWWGRYCAFLRYRGRRERAEPDRIRAFYDLVDSLQPLVE